MHTHHPRAEAYYVVKEREFFSLMDVVSTKIRQGWTPQGGITYIDQHYHQPMVYWEHSEQEEAESEKRFDDFWMKMLSQIPRQQLDEMLAEIDRHKS